jgi:uncharacterized SAM-binding protein YcdF (DUF218 family)
VSTGPPRRRWRYLRILAAAAVLWLAGLIWFTEESSRYLAEDPRHTDAIIVLTGGSDRVKLGIDLMARGMADRLFVSGVHAGVTRQDLLGAAGAEEETGRLPIEIGYAAGDTAGNARETADWVRAHGIGSLRLVTSDYHMARSLLEFRAALPEVEIVPQAVDSQAVHMEEWWRWPGTARLVIAEYTKLLLASARASLDELYTSGADALVRIVGTKAGARDRIAPT